MDVVRYIHQNPVKAGITRRADEWVVSSSIGYYGKQYYPPILLQMLRLYQKQQEMKH